MPFCAMDPPRVYISSPVVNQKSVRESPVEAGSNISTVALRVAGDEKGSLETETVKYGQSATGLGPENDYAGEGQQ
jgi:hypothetical protein